VTESVALPLFEGSIIPQSLIPFVAIERPACPKCKAPMMLVSIELARPGVDLVGGEGFAVDASLIAADANKQRSIAGQDWRRDRDPARSSRAVKEYLATLDDTAWGAASDVVPKFVSPSDPAAQWTGAHKGPAFFAYSNNYLIDVKFGVIIDVEASRAIRPAEVSAARTMIERTEERFSLKPERLVADTALWGSSDAELAG
jgi:hypothetical protein